jgi:hypothetical protein
MEKKQYEHLKDIRNRIKNGTSTFAERNIIKIIDKKKSKNVQNQK